MTAPERAGSSSTVSISGEVAPGFERVADAFALNFRDRGDRGAAVAVVIEGTTVVDLWAGEARNGAPWMRSTRTAVFSVSKAITALCLLMAADLGLLDLDAPVSLYWPEFGVNGKHRISVRHALAHRAGVVGFSEPWDAVALAAWTPIVDDLAGQTPVWEPDTAFAYHPVSVGFIAGEILRRATGLRPSQWLAEHIAGPLGLEMTYGADPDDADFAPLRSAGPGGVGEIPLAAPDEPFVRRAMLADGAYGPDLFTAAAGPAFLGPESPAANVVTRARDLAQLFSAVADPQGDSPLVSREVLAAAAVPISFGKPFVGVDKGDTWGTGFMLHSARRGMAGPGSFGHDGAGGHLAFAQPGLGLGFGYHTALAGGDDDIRAEALCAALRECL
ncbi:serine hydrolase domain-containing protein [uncultured Microbacterium sp.]|uniref:serine hydrolase domain-containing protein n=1 Tax=uncultured Microbacterium sp. TaxID=191216 RepID=UPI0028E8EB84|nr:serine hydrolase domain-containing protein [uncultured Microbacterium sp.]